MPFDIRSLSLYPEEPGVYLMKDIDGRILYIGKAKNLRSRLKQYFGLSGDEREMIPYLISQIEAIDTIVALTEKDALILENNLIKRHRPKYNILLKDDKTFISLAVTKHRWPMLKLVRIKPSQTAKDLLFGPYTSALAARQIYDLIMHLFPLRQCSDAELASRKRPCLLFDIKKCIAPCIGHCTKEEYDRHVDAAIRLLKGQNKEVLDQLRASMKEASELLEFEKAEELLRLIEQIEHITSIQHIEHRSIKDCDAIGICRKADAVLIAVLHLEAGRVIASEHFSFHLVASTDEEILSSFIFQHYRQLPAIPSEILLPFPMKEARMLAEILAEARGKKIEISSPQKGQKRALTEMAFRNAKAQFARQQDERALTEKMLLDLQETLRLSRYPRCIECLDTSNISGTDPVASLCCFIHGTRDKNRTRLFRIKSAGDDYSAMREALLRHFSKAKNTGILCDLLLVDGGKGQLNIALSVFEELQIASVDVAAIAKEDSRHTKGLTLEKIFLPHEKDPISIDAGSPLLFLLQRIRDEAHRLAIEYHRKRRSKRTIRSALEDIPGIGPIKMRRLLNYFGSIRALKEAPVESILQVEGITKKDAERIDSLLRPDVQTE